MKLSGRWTVLLIAFASACHSDDSVLGAPPFPSLTPTMMNVSAPTPYATAPAATTAAPPATILPTRTLTAHPDLKIREETVTLLAYPYDAFQRDARDRTFNIPYKKFDASAYSAAARAPSERKFRAVVLENDYLRLTFLPELGGRLYQVLYKPTQQTIFYNNRVLKPSPWGPEQQGGWLAAGGMEWALPVNEHGYEWGMPWAYTVQRAADGATISLWDSTEDNRVRARVDVTLPANSAYWIVHPRIENAMRAAVRLQFWINAQIALGARHVSPDTEFILPTTNVFVHSTGNDFIPAAFVPGAAAKSPAEPMAWPHVAGRDLSRYANWHDYLGVFVLTPQAQYVGAYNHSTELGIVRVFPRERAPGVKLFAFGPQFGGRKLFADDGSDYFELWGGLNRTFFQSDDVTLGAGEAREWDEYWIPLAQTGGLSVASLDAIIRWDRNGFLFR